MNLVERRIYAGCTLEIQTYLEERETSAKNAENKQRFESEGEYREFMLERSRRDFIRLVNENFTPAGFYVTLTDDREHECHTAAEIKRQRDLYWRRILYWGKKHDKKINMVAVVGEGKSTSKWHIHMIIEGVPKEIIEEKWTFGENIRVSPLRKHNYYDGVDHGADYTALANYLFDHWTPKQGSHKWKATRTMRQPEIETRIMRASDELKRLFGTGSRAGRPMPDTPDGYMLVNEEWTKYGFRRLEYVLIPDQRKRKKQPEKSALDKVEELFKKPVEMFTKTAGWIRSKVKRKN